MPIIRKVQNLWHRAFLGQVICLIVEFGNLLLLILICWILVNFIWIFIRKMCRQLLTLNLWREFDIWYLLTLDFESCRLNTSMSQCSWSLRPVVGITKHDTRKLLQIWSRSRFHTFVTFVSLWLQSVSTGILFKIPNLAISWFHISSYLFAEVISTFLHRYCRIVANMTILAHSLFQNLVLFNRLIEILLTYLTQRCLL